MRWQWDLQKQWEGQGWVFLGMLHCMDKICCTTRGRFFFMEFTLGPGEHVQGWLQCNHTLERAVRSIQSKSFQNCKPPFHEVCLYLADLAFALLFAFDFGTFGAGNSELVSSCSDLRLVRADFKAGLRYDHVVIYRDMCIRLYKIDSTSNIYDIIWMNIHMHMYVHTVLTRTFWGECWAWTSARVALLPLGRQKT